MPPVLEATRARIEDLARKIGAPRNLLPSFTGIRWQEELLLEVDARGFHLYFNDSGGKAFSSRTFPSEDELLYALFSDITSTMASGWEAAHRIDGRQDSRRRWFPKQEELMATLESAWGDRCVRDHAEILREYPFRDG